MKTDRDPRVAQDQKKNKCAEGKKPTQQWVFVEEKFPAPTGRPCNPNDFHSLSSSPSEGSGGKSNPVFHSLYSGLHQRYWTSTHKKVNAADVSLVKELEELQEKKNSLVKKKTEIENQNEIASLATSGLQNSLEDLQNEIKATENKISELANQLVLSSNKRYSFK